MINCLIEFFNSSDICILFIYLLLKDEEDEQELANDVSPDSLGLLWDDEDTRAFYENLPDLVAIIPSILYKDSKGEAAETETSNKEAESLDNENEDEMAVDEDPVEEVNLEDDEELQEAVRRT